MEKYTEIIFILDRSGSMAGLEMDTIGGYNATIEKQKAQQPEKVKSRRANIQRCKGTDLFPFHQIFAEIISQKPVDEP